eukprot:1791776-Pyramimonas_sp.AAC.1
MLVQGHICGIICWPPSETWSAARHMPIPGDGMPPRPLRSQQEPWGLGHLSEREDVQVAVGNFWLRTCIEFLFLSLKHGVTAIMGHPAISEAVPEVPSPWRLPELKMLATQP